MNPADLDIPDPCNSSQEMSPISNDELLSQLAGKEIERLLAEVDQQLDAAMRIRDKAPAPAPALALRRYPQRPVAPLPAPAIQDQAAGLAQLAQDAEERRDEKPPLVIFSVEPDDTSVPDAQGQAHNPMEVVGTPVHVFERVAGIEPDDGGWIAPRNTDYFADFELPLPAYLKPLAWLNAPFEGMSQAALGALGKVAIVLFLSALVTLTYVIVLTQA
jgi:hypothetical protein